MPLSSWSHIKGHPRRPATGSCMMERRHPWETFNRQTSAFTFLFFFYLNGVKHLHKWEASQYTDPTKKSCLPPRFCFKGEKKSSIYFLNLFCTFCEICSDMDRSQMRPLSPQNSNILNPAPALRNKKKTHKGPALPDLLNTRNIIFVFFPHYYYYFF